jgi:serine/threonine protein kinase
MTSLERYVGQVLDEKYRLERLLGQGGMGAVYLATHLGTERYVALKVITPEFMRNAEFVERFKREARAAGRLRHPNVVDVTDFGFARAGAENVAYLVMEYLDGCTLSDVLAEENRLPLYWVVDILEQVCSAVHEAHRQGVVHRDLKPDNIWLEPNRLGGYRVKVLDFGIAKTGGAGLVAEVGSFDQSTRPSPESETLALGSAISVAAGVGGAKVDQKSQAGITDSESQTLIKPAARNDHRVGKLTAAAPPGDGAETQLFDRETQRTAILHKTTQAAATAAATGLTRVGAILGTPLYMSPEQCRGEHLDARSDIYSLGIIAYQMLAGMPPFTGEAMPVMRAQIENQPIPLRQHNPKVPKRVAGLIMSALKKDPVARPQTASAFANALRANADGLGTLYRRAFALYSEYFPKFLRLSLLAHIPAIVLALAILGLRLAEPRMSKLVFTLCGAFLGLVQIPASILAASTISGVTAIIVTQLAVAPMKPVELRVAFDVLRRRWRPFLNTSIRVSLRIMIGFILLVVPGFVMTVRYLLYAPVVLIEGLEKKAARKRARELASRSWRTMIIVTLIQFLVPTIVASLVTALLANLKQNQHTVQFKVTTQLPSLLNIFILPLLSIVSALLYLKMRQLGGETLSDVMAQIEEVEGARSQWQQRMRTRPTINTPPKTS